MSHSTQNTLFHIWICPKPNAIVYTLPKLYSIVRHCRPILIHWQTHPNTLPKLYPILYLNTLPCYLKRLTKLYPILIHRRYSTFSHNFDEPTAETIPYLNSFRKKPNKVQNQFLVGSQSEASTKNRKNSSANQNRVSQCRKTPNALGSVERPFSALGSL